MDKISVIIPVYKTEKYLDKCIESIVNQTYKNLEIILVDDESPDNCPIKCDQWAKKDNRIKVLHIENKGVANARNIALDIVSGNYVSFIDSDDFAENDMLEMLYRCIKSENSDIAVCGFYSNGDAVDENLLENSDVDEVMKLIAQGDFVYGVLWNKLYRTDIIKDIKMPNFVCCEDSVFNYFAFKNSKSIGMIKDKKYHYVYHSSSATHMDFNIGAFDAVKSKQIILSDSKGTALEPYAVTGLITSCFVVLSGAINASGFKSERKMLRKTILHYKSLIYRSKMYSKKDKIKTFILSLSEGLYERFVGKKSE